jgi:hypothetical protein
VWVLNRVGLLTYTRGPAGVWVLNCVGLLNYKAFLLFLAYTLAAAGLAAGLLAGTFVGIFRGLEAGTQDPARRAFRLSAQRGRPGPQPGAFVWGAGVWDRAWRRPGATGAGGHHVAASQSRTTSGDLSPLSCDFCARGVHAARPWLAQRERARCRLAKRVAKAASGGARGCTQAREPRPEALLGLARKGRVTALLPPRPRRRCRFPRAGRRSCLWRS